MIREMLGNIVRRLAEKAGSSAQAAELPDNVGEYRMTHAHAAYLVHYTGSVYSPLRATMERRMTFDVYVLTRKLAGTTGLASHVDAVLSHLVGFNPGPAAGRMIATRDRFTVLAKDLYQHVVTFEFVAPLVHREASE